MSWRHTLAAGELVCRTPSVKAVLLALGHHAAEYDGRCWPSLERLCLFTGMGESTVRQALRTIEANGWMTTARSKGGRTRTGYGITSIYTLTLPGADAMQQGKGNPPAAGDNPPAAAVNPPAAGPKSSIEDSRKETRASRARASELLPDGWQPDDVALARARKDFPNVDIDLETNRFVDTNRANGTLIAEPTSAWRAWLGRGAQFAARDKAQSAAADRPGRRAGGADRTAAPGLRAMLSAPPRVVGYGLAGPPDDSDR